MKIIALFFPALVALKMNKKEEQSLKKELFDSAFMYCMFVIAINLFVISVITYVLGVDGLTIAVFESFSFFVLYTASSCCCAAFIGGLTKILRKNTCEIVSK